MKLVQIEKRNKISRAEISELFVDLQAKVWENSLSEPIPMGKLSGRTARNFITPPDAAAPDCLTCGLCCAVLFDVQVGCEDTTQAEHYWDVPLDENDEIVVNRILRHDTHTGKCLALTGETGRDIKCEIYEQRPETCRLFEAGSDKCHALRRAFNLEPPLSQPEIFDAMLKILDRDTPADPNQLMILNCEITRSENNQKLMVTVWTEDDKKHFVHEYDAANEKRLEGDFVGLTLAQARELIATPPDGNKRANPNAVNFI